MNNVIKCCSFLEELLWIDWCFMGFVLSIAMLGLFYEVIKKKNKKKNKKINKLCKIKILKARL